MSLSKLSVAAFVGVPSALSATLFVAFNWPSLFKIITTVGLFLVSGVVSFGTAVYKNLSPKWAERVALRADKWASNAISKYEDRYRDYVASIHHDVDLKGVSVIGNFTLSVKQVFVDLSLAADPPQSLNRAVIPVSGASGAKESVGERHSVWHYMQPVETRGARLAIIGPPGAGKTTLLKHLVGSLARREGEGVFQDKIPVVLYLRECAELISASPKATLADMVRESLSLLDEDEPPQWLERQLKQGTCVVMLDGLDEVASREARGKVVEWADQQMARYSLCTWIVTSRPQGYRSKPLASATVLQVRPFTEHQVARFLANWYLATNIRAAGRDDVGIRRKAGRESDELMKRLVQNTSLFDLATNPLLLTMMAHVHLYRGLLPGSRAELYKEMCSVLLGNRQEAKGLRLTLTTAQNELIVRTLAFRMMSDGTRDISSRRAEQVLRPVLRSVGTSLGASKFLEELEASSGLVLEREAGIYSFAHLTLQEYLTAAHIRERAGLTTLLDHVEDDWWREVHLLYASQADATPIIEKCLAIDDPPPIAALALALDCVDLAVEVAPQTRDKLMAVVAQQSRSKEQRRRDHMRRVEIARKLRDWTRLTEDTYVIRDQLTAAECSFLMNHSPLMTIRHDGSGVPLDYFQASRVIAEIQGIMGSGWVYRLPNAVEVNESQHLTALAAKHGLWLDGGELLYRSSADQPSAGEILERVLQRISNPSASRRVTHAKLLGRLQERVTSLNSAAAAIDLLDEALRHLTDAATMSHSRTRGNHLPYEAIQPVRAHLLAALADGAPVEKVKHELDLAIADMVIAYCKIEDNLSDRGKVRVSGSTHRRYLPNSLGATLEMAQRPLLGAISQAMWIDGLATGLAESAGVIMVVRYAGG